MEVAAAFQASTEMSGAVCCQTGLTDGENMLMPAFVFFQRGLAALNDGRPMLPVITGQGQ
jgi:hypothetical protein